MPISMVVRDQRGSEVEAGEVPWSPRYGWLVPASTPLLSGVDRVGTTAFNGRQCVRQVLPEVEWLRSQFGHEPDAAVMLGELQRLARATERPPHRLLWFLGD